MRLNVSLWRDRLLPKSIVARMTLILFIGILVAQSLGGVLWSRQLQQSEVERLSIAAENMGARMGQTIQFFSRLPREYRHIVLDQLRDMGGTRFFVSINTHYIDLEKVESSALSLRIIDQLKTSANSQLAGKKIENIDLVAFDNVRVLSGENRMVELPQRWQSFALLDPGDESPVIVAQIQVGQKEWIYLATVFPSGRLLDASLLTSERLISLVLVSLTVLILTTILVRWIVRPLRKLAKQADVLGRGQNPDFLPEEGSVEMQTTIRAFNQMGTRIRKFISDRERLFASISHDLKTPLTRARLRAELVDDASLRDGLVNDLENLEMLVHASLQMIKENEIHENITQVDLARILKRCLESAQVADLPSSLEIPEPFVIEGRPLSLQRLFANLIDNALHYGRCADVKGWIDKDTDQLIVQVLDKGPGLTYAQKKRVFEPFYRLNKAPSDIHVGLGMGIVRSIAQLHGAEVQLLDRASGGLVVEVRFPL